MIKIVAVALAAVVVAHDAPAAELANPAQRAGAVRKAKLAARPFSFPTPGKGLCVNGVGLFTCTTQAQCMANSWFLFPNTWTAGLC